MSADTPVRVPPAGERVAVAMSGGVDSAVAASLLARAGADVVGVTLKLWCYGDTDLGDRACCSLSAIDDARRTCDVIGIPHFVLDLESHFGERVIDRFVDDYLAGRTPNPCVLCNQHVKFTALLERVRPMGATWVATGHHARLDPRGANGPELRRGADAGKDQSYALWSVPRDTLRHTLLPVGELSKDAVRAHAHEAGLPVASKAESQDICFVPDGDYGRFVAGRVEVRAPALDPGPIVDVDGRRLGTHAGVARYTVGQRRGLGIAHEEPLYVVAIDADTNTLVAGPRAALARRGFGVNEVNWVSVPGLADERRLGIKIRYRHPGTPGLVRPLGTDRVEVVLENPQDAVSPGQSAVFYDGDLVLGGGVIADRGEVASPAGVDAGGEERGQGASG